MISKLPRLLGRKQDAENRVINVATLSTETGISRQTIYAWLEKDAKLQRFEAATITAFCKYFGCDIGDLLTVIHDDAVEAQPN